MYPGTVTRVPGYRVQYTGYCRLLLWSAEALETSDLDSKEWEARTPHALFFPFAFGGQHQTTAQGDASSHHA